LEHFFIFPSIGNFIIPTDELHHFSEGWRKTTNQLMKFQENQNPINKTINKNIDPRKIEEHNPIYR